jgi:hypothetical protein
VNDGLSLSVFTIEVDRRPVLVFESRKHAEAEEICADEKMRAKLSSLTSGGKSLCDDFAILRVRLARSDEKVLYRDQASMRSNDGGLVAFYLVDLD